MFYPLNRTVVRMACRKLGLSNANIVFDDLQKTYLVQRYSHYRWNIHNLISAFCQQKLVSEEKEQINLYLAYYYLDRSRTPSDSENFILSDDAFIWKVRACRHFQLAKDYTHSEVTLNWLTKTVKARGYYEIFIQLCADQKLENNDFRDTWLDYNYAHCCQIIGRLRKSLEIIQPLIYSTHEDEKDKRLAFVRLYAEIMAELGKPKAALDKLREELESTDENTVPITVIQHVKSIEVKLLTDLGILSEAESLCKKLLRDCISRKDTRGYCCCFNAFGYYL